jgi:hypothetical protein
VSESTRSITNHSPPVLNQAGRTPVLSITNADVCCPLVSVASCAETKEKDISKPNTPAPLTTTKQPNKQTNKQTNNHRDTTKNREVRGKGGEEAL